MLNKAILVAITALVAGCGILFPSAPVRFPQFSEYPVAGRGVYQIPQWSPDSRYLAFLDRAPNLVIYDTETGRSWTAANNVSGRHFAWTPNGDLTYLKYRPDLSGSPYPIILDLHRVDLNGGNDEIIAANLSSAGAFAWFSDGERIAALLTEPSSRTYFNDVYLLNIVTGSTTLFLEAEDLQLEYIGSLALSADEQSLLVHGVRGQNDPLAGQIVIYDLEAEIVRDRIFPSQIIPSANATYPWPAMGDGTNAGWVGGQRWFLAQVNAPSGDCYNSALFFFDTSNLQNSFCVPTVEGIIAYPTISPDLSKISYVTVVGVGQYYVMIADVPSDLLERLELNGE
jgi:hypothetical protein